MTTNDKADQRDLDEVVIGPLTPIGADAAISVLARGTRDNPNHIAAFGDDPSLRLVRIISFLESLNSIIQWQALVARDYEGAIVGVMTMTEPGRCCDFWRHGSRTFLRAHDDNGGSHLRIANWLHAWSERDPNERHWHLGPMAVETGLQGRGIGSQLLRVSCAQMDAGKETAYLETDRVQNVGLYGRFGFEVVSEHTVLGATNWFMTRRPRGVAGDDRGRREDADEADKGPHSRA